MLMVAGRLMAPEGALAVVTGENLGQVASQTLANLGVVADAATADGRVVFFQLFIVEWRDHIAVETNKLSRVHAESFLS